VRNYGGESFGSISLLDATVRLVRLLEEFEALATEPFEARGRVTDEYLTLLRRAWTPDPVGFVSGAGHVRRLGGQEQGTDGIGDIRIDHEFHRLDLPPGFGFQCKSGFSSSTCAGSSW